MRQSSKRPNSKVLHLILTDFYNSLQMLLKRSTWPHLFVFISRKTGIDVHKLFKVTYGKYGSVRLGFSHISIITSINLL